MGERLLALVLAASTFLLIGCAAGAPSYILDTTSRYTEVIDLPPPDLAGAATLEYTLSQRRSQRTYVDQDLTLATISQLLWAGQGITDRFGHRTAPSAGATYPLELYVLTDTEFMHYLPAERQVELRDDDWSLDELASAAFGQEFVAEAPAVFIIAAVAARTEAEYGSVAGSYVDRESGHAAQNMLLEATALDLAATPVGGFDPPTVARLLALPPGEEVLYLIPIGHPAG